MWRNERTSSPRPKIMDEVGREPQTMIIPLLFYSRPSSPPLYRGTRDEERRGVVYQGKCKKRRTGIGDLVPILKTPSSSRPGRDLVPILNRPWRQA